MNSPQCHGRTKAKLSLAATVFLVACILGCAKVAEVRLWNHTGSSIALSVGGRIFKVVPNGSARFNMPLELGIDIGCRAFGAGQSDKSFLIFDRDRFRFQSYVSDIAGQDIANPMGAIASAAMMLRYSFHLEQEARDIEMAIRAVLDDGYKTADLQNGRPGRPVSTSEIGKLVEQRVATLVDHRHAYHAV